MKRAGQRQPGSKSVLAVLALVFPFQISASTGARTEAPRPPEASESRLIVKTRIDLGTVPPAALAEIPLRPGRPVDGYAVETALRALLSRRIAFSPDGTRVAYIEGRRVFVDGQASEEYDRAGYLTFSPDSRRFAYFACIEGVCFAVVDGVKHEAVSSWVGLLFSPDSKHVVYSARVGAGEGGKWKVVVDGIAASAEYDFIDFPSFNSVGQLAILAVRGDKKFYVVDDIEGKQYDSIGWIVFSPDGRRHAYFAGKQVGSSSSRFMTVDGVEGKRYWAVSEPIFSSDGRRVAYRACLGAPPSGWILGNVITRPAKAKEVVVVDGEESAAHGCDLSQLDLSSNWLVRSVAFSRDGKRVAYAASAAMAYTGKTGKKSVVVDGRPGPAVYDAVAGLSFSADGKRVAFAAKRAGYIFAVIDGVEYPTNIVGTTTHRVNGRSTFPLNPATAGAPAFSPAGNHVAYVRSRGKAGKKFWRGKAGGELEVVIDGVTSETYDRIADLMWQDEATVRAVACRGDRCFRIEFAAPLIHSGS